MLSNLRLAFLCGALVCAAGRYCWAHDEEGGQPKGMAACKEDKERLCGDVQPGGGGIMRCMKDHMGELSGDCREFMQKKMQSEGAPKDLAGKKKPPMDGWDAACKDDADKLCKGVEPGGGRIGQCLKEHMDEVSAKCKEFGESKKKEWKEKRDAWSACQKDADSLCKGVEPGGGRIGECLKQHKDELSAGCSELMSRKGGKPAKKAESEGPKEGGSGDN